VTQVYLHGDVSWCILVIDNSVSKKKLGHLFKNGGSTFNGKGIDMTGS
jgi:hypothetical protein